MAKDKVDLRKIAIYTRQSLDKKDSLSIEGQIDECKRIIKTEEEPEIYTDRGKSGGNIKRDDLQRLLQDVKKHKIKKIVVFKLDRFSRNIIDFYNMWEVLQANKTEFISVNESFDTSTSLGRLMMNILVAFAQMERENIQARVKSNYYYRVQLDGRWAGGPAPYGFTLSKNETNVSTLVIDEREIEIVKLAFDMYANDPYSSYRQIAKKLSEIGARSRRSNGAFDGATLSRMLQNTVYCKADNLLYKYLKIRKIHFLNGEEEWTGKTSAHIVGKKPNNGNIRKYVSLEEQSVYLTNFEGIIDSETFIKVQERMAKNEQIKKSNAPSKMEELSGKLKCAKCGYAIHLGEYLCLRCHGRYELKICDVSFKGIKFREIQEKVGEEIQKHLNPLAMKMLSKTAEAKRKQDEMECLQKEIDNLVNLVAQSKNPIPIALKEIDERQQKIDKLALDLQRNNYLNIGTNIPHRIPLKYSRLTMQEKKLIINELIDKIFVSENGDIEIIWYI